MGSYLCVLCVLRVSTGNTTSTMQLSGVWVMSSSANYTLYFSPLNFQEATSYCYSQGGYLASIASESEYAFLSRLLLDAVCLLMPLYCTRT